MSAKKVIIGIDLGTTYSLVAYHNEQGTTIIKNDFDSHFTPSAVAWDPKKKEATVGQLALDMSHLKPEFVATQFKRSMGTQQSYLLGKKKFTPISLSSLVLKELKRQAEKHLGYEVDQAIISVPAYFSEQQRAETIQAGEVVGLEVLRIINEPTAAGINFGLAHKDLDEHMVILDLGGGTFDVSVLEVFEDSVQIKATSGLSQYGGEDFTRILLEFICKKASMDFENLTKNKQDYARCYKRADEAKKSFEDKLSITFRFKDQSPEVIISRKEVLELFAGKYQQIIPAVREALACAGLSRDDIQRVLCVGGGSQTLGFKKFVEKLFKKEIQIEAEPDLCVVKGAAIQARLYSKDRVIKDFVVTDVLSHSIGVEVSQNIAGEYREGFFSPVVHRGTTLPAKRSSSFSTLSKNQTVMNLSLFEGESRKVTENQDIGTFEVKGIPKGPEGQVVELELLVDLNGNIMATATVAKTKKQVEAVFNRKSQIQAKDVEKIRSQIEKIKLKYFDEARYDYLRLELSRIATQCHFEDKPFFDQLQDRLELVHEQGEAKKIEELYQKLDQVITEFNKDESW